MRFKFVFSLVVFFLSACKKDGGTTFNNVKGTLTNALGCSDWIILQDNGTPWQPMNLESFQVTLKGGQPVIFSFVLTDYSNICTAGKTIELTSIQNQ
jgi:hypothetical protein